MPRYKFTNSEDILIRRTWGNRWGAFGNLQARNGHILLLTGIRNGAVVHCTDAPHGLPEQYTGIVKFSDGSSLLVMVYKITRQQLLERKWRYNSQHENLIAELIKSGVPYYKA